VKKKLFLLALFILLKPVFLVIDLIVNYEYISKVLCVKKAKTKNPFLQTKKCYSRIGSVVFRGN
jgi:hypothetical protein